MYTTLPEIIMETCKMGYTDSQIIFDMSEDALAQHVFFTHSA
jgi:hypothetical protein